MGNCDGEAATRVQVTGPAPAPAPAAAISSIAVTPRPGVIKQPVTIDITGQRTCAITVAYGDGRTRAPRLQRGRHLLHHGRCDRHMQGRVRRDLDVR